MTGSFAGVLLLWMAHLLPMEGMKVHIYQSLPLLESEFIDSQVMEGYEATLTGSFTDCLMLEHAIYAKEGRSALEQAMMMYRGEASEGAGWAPGTSLEAYLEGSPMAREVSYARYWHGYLVILKPLLMLSNVQTLRVLNAMVQMLMLCGLTGLCFRQRKGRLGMALAAALMLLYPFVLYFSLSLSICYYLVLAALTVQVVWGDRWKSQAGFDVFFLIVGMVTAYFDFLTYPLVTLGFPLGAAIYHSKERWRKQCGKMLRYSCFWGIGYLGFWACKWVTADILFGAGTIQDALRTIGERTHSASELSLWEGYGQVIRENISYFFHWPFYLVILAAAVGQVIGAGRGRKREKCPRLLKHPAGSIKHLAGSVKHLGGRGVKCLAERVKSRGIPCILLAALPFIWYFFTQNHSMEHSIFTCKILSITVFAVLIFIGSDVREEDGEAVESFVET